MKVLNKKELNAIDGYFRALNYLSVGQLYLLDNPLLKRPLSLNDIKPRIVGHWGTAPGQNFIYAHLNRIIKKNNLNMIYISGPGHGGEAIIANNYLDGTYTRFYPNISEDIEGMRRLFKQFSFPGGVSSHVAPNVPGSIHEGGELGYSLSHAAGAVLDNPKLIAACVVGDGEAETGSLATSWNINKFINPKTDGFVLPILHRNGYKIANPTVLGRMSDEEVGYFFTGLGWDVYFVSGNDTNKMHQAMAAALDKVVNDYKKIKTGKKKKYPMIVLTTPKGWTGPKKIKGNMIENSFRSHQVPFDVVDNITLELLRTWLMSYRPEELFDEAGRLRHEYRLFIPDADKCMGANVASNHGVFFDIVTPKWENYSIEVPSPGSILSSDTTVLGGYIRDLFVLNKDNKNFRIFGPDEALSNKLDHVFEVTNRTWNIKTLKSDQYLDTLGRVMDSYLSENVCEGMLEGYLLTGRYGMFHTYEAFSRIIDSMVSQHIKWMKTAKEVSWRGDIASLNILLTSHVFQQDHNGYTHQDPGFLNHLVTKKSEYIGIYLPVDSNTLLAVFDSVIKSRNKVNAIVASKHMRPQWLNKIQAKVHVEKGIGIWDFVSDSRDPDIVIVSAGETPTMEAVAACDILKTSIKNVKVRFVNVINLMKLANSNRHPDGLSDKDFDLLFTKNKPVIFNFHGYPNLIYDLVHDRHNKNFYVYGYMEEGSITTPFDIRVQNGIDRFNLVINILKVLDNYKKISKPLNDWCLEMLQIHKKYVRDYGVDMPYILDYKFKCSVVEKK